MSFWNLFRRKKKKPVAPPATVRPGVPEVPPWNPPMVTSEFAGWANPNPYFCDFPGIGLSRIVTGTEAPHYDPWDLLKKAGNREPAIGYYDEREPAVERWRLEQMKTAGITVACKQIGWSHARAVKPLHWLPPFDPLLYRWVVDNHMAIPGSGVKFCLSNWDAVAGTGDGPVYFAALKRDNGWNSDDLRMSMRLYAQSVGTIMQHPDYWKIDDRPVLYRGWAHTLAFYSERFEFDVTAEEIVSIWKSEIRQLVGIEPYLVATSMDPPAHQYLKAWGFDCLTQYVLHSKGWENTMGVYRHHWTKDLATCRTQGLGYILPYTAGYDGAAWDTDEHKAGDRHIPTAPQFEAHVREAIKLARGNRDVVKACGGYAWSEHGEGGIMEPMKPGMLHDGDEMVRGHARAVLA